MWHPLHPQRTNYLTLISYKNSLLVTICKILPSTTQLFSTPPPFLFLPILPLGPISLLPLVQSSPIGKTCPEDVQWRLVPHPRDFLCHPEQMDRVVHRSGHIGEMGESDSKRSLFPGTALSPRLCRSPNPFTILENPK